MSSAKQSCVILSLWKMSVSWRTSARCSLHAAKTTTRTYPLHILKSCLDVKHHHLQRAGSTKPYCVRFCSTLASRGEEGTTDERVLAAVDNCSIRHNLHIRRCDYAPVDSSTLEGVRWLTRCHCCFWVTGGSLAHTKVDLMGEVIFLPRLV